MPLICDCRNFLEREWEVHVHHVYREANGCADVLAKRGTCQQTKMTMYSDCPTFAYVIYARDGSGLGEFQLCAPGPDVGVVWTWFVLNKTPVFHQKKKWRFFFLNIWLDHIKHLSDLSKVTKYESKGPRTQFLWHNPEVINCKL